MATTAKKIVQIQKVISNVFDSAPDFRDRTTDSVSGGDRRIADAGSKPSLLHRIAGPPYDPSPILLPTEPTTRVPKMCDKFHFLYFFSFFFITALNVRPISLFLKRSFIIYKSYHANLLFVKG
jgi:hypothetical protein